MDSKENEPTQDLPAGSTRREFLQQVTTLTAGMTISSYINSSAMPVANFHGSDPRTIRVSMLLNGKKKTIDVDPRVTLLDALREQIKLTGTKKGCDRGQCGACTVLLNGKRVNSCLILAVMIDGKEITTIEGIGTPENLHPLQLAFLEHDAFQCGYCTPGQICSALGMLKEGHAKSDDEIRESMSGNICRCGAYQHILEAIKDVQHSKSSI